jgi:hypothetical protein
MMVTVVVARMGGVVHLDDIAVARAVRQLRIPVEQPDLCRVIFDLVVAHVDLHAEKAERGLDQPPVDVVFAPDFEPEPLQCDADACRVCLVV